MNTEIISRYAKALYEKTPQEKLEQYLTLMGLIKESITKKMLLFFGHPLISTEKKKKVLKDIFKVLSLDTHQETEKTIFNFLCLLLDKKLFLLFEQVINQYQAFAEHALNISTGTVITAIPLDNTLKARLEKKLTHQLGKKMILDHRLDPKILGGLVINISFQQLDLSIKGKLDRLRKYLRGSY